MEISIPRNEWFHITVNFIGVNDDCEGIRVYLNGALAASDTSLTGPRNKLPNGEITLGYISRFYRISFYVDELFFFNKRLNCTEITRLSQIEYEIYLLTLKGWQLF